MKQLNPEKLYTEFLPGTTTQSPVTPRRYTLTHSDRTCELFLCVGLDYNHRIISGWYTRFMRYEVLAAWKQDEKGYSLHVYLHVSGGLIFGRASWRETIFRSELSLVLEAIRHGDRNLFTAYPKLDHASIHVHFQSSDPNHYRIEQWGVLYDYR